MNSQAQPPVAVTTGRSVFPGAFSSLWERPEPRDAIRSRRYDVVVLQEDLPETRIEDFRDHARRFVAEVRQEGARPILLMAWAYPRLGWITMAEIARAHRDAAAELKVEVAPVDLAWQRAMQQRSRESFRARSRTPQHLRHLPRNGGRVCHDLRNRPVTIDVQTGWHGDRRCVISEARRVGGSATIPACSR